MDAGGACYRPPRQQMTITGINHRALARAFDSFKSTAPRDVLLLSPSAEDVAFLCDQFPRARVFVATRKAWDLNEAFPSPAKVDLVVASNVFHYSTDPNLWFGNVLGMTERFVLQDLVSRRRSGKPDGLCDDGDSLRYCFSVGGVESDFASPYDLTAFEKQIAYFEAFDGGRNEYHVLPAAAPRHLRGGRVY
jgi:hypothetical protein